MSCKRCGSTRILDISGKTSDMFGMWKDGREYLGYVPSNLGIGGSDYMEFKYCLNCGQIQGDFPIEHGAETEYFDEEEIE